ncbi:MAG: hypothetical protein KQH57_12830 [Actinomycetales bacterium]|nr:hypothetical protein [Actinomycetales bacterium]
MEGSWRQPFDWGTATVVDVPQGLMRVRVFLDSEQHTDRAPSPSSRRRMRGDQVTRKHPRVVLRRELAEEAPWTRHPRLLAPDDALARVAHGTPWVVHWCGGPSASSADDGAAQQLAKVRDYGRFVGPTEQERLVAKAEKRRRTHTVLLAESWVSARGTEVIMFAEGGPRPWAGRCDPFTPG